MAGKLIRVFELLTLTAYCWMLPSTHTRLFVVLVFS